MLSVNLKSVWSSVTCEPAMLMYFTALALSQVCSQNLLLQKACHPGGEVPLLTASCPDEVKAQKTVTNIQTWKDMIVLFGPVLFVLFAGPWSDSHGKRRKPLMWIPLCGQIISDLLCILNVYFWGWPITVAALSQSVPGALTGWRSCFLIGVISYVSDISPIESRTTRAGICAAVYFLGSPIGAVVFGMFFHNVGFYGIFLLCVTLNTAALVSILFFVSESDPEIVKECKLKLWEGIDLGYATQCLRTINKPREGYKRAVVLLTVFLAPITMAPLQGEYSVLLFFLRYEFGWDEADYGYYAAYKCVIIFCGTVITTGVFSRLLGISDALIGMMASVTLVLASLGYTFATATWELFLYPLIDFMHGAGLAVVYSIISKNVEAVELGQANSMLGVADAMFPLINMPLYNQVYNRTFTTLAGVFFLLSAMYGVIALAVFWLIFALQKTDNTQEKPRIQNKT